MSLISLVAPFMSGSRHSAASLRIGSIMLLFPLVLGGCAMISPPPAPVTAEQAASRPYHEKIMIKGRLSVRYQQNGNDEAIHGSFSWSQVPGHTTVSLFSPLGQTIAMIEITPEVSTLTQAGQAPRRADNVDALAANALGWPLPVSGLRDWLQGFAIDSEGRRFVASPLAGGTEVTTRDGWRLRYAGWQEDTGQSRPRRIDLERSTAEAGEVAIRIVIDDWQPG
jgi:outer membrane lipoprotein LolB